MRHLEWPARTEVTQEILIGADFGQNLLDVRKGTGATVPRRMMKLDNLFERALRLPGQAWPHLVKQVARGGVAKLRGESGANNEYGLRRHGSCRSRPRVFSRPRSTRLAPRFTPDAT